MIAPGQVPKGWKRGWPLRIEKAKHTILICQIDEQPYSTYQPMAPDSIAFVHFAPDQFPVEWLHWWYNMPYEPRITLELANKQIETLSTQHRVGLDELSKTAKSCIQQALVRGIMVGVAAACLAIFPIWWLS